MAQFALTLGEESNPIRKHQMSDRLTLDPQKIIETVAKLKRRISERFPTRGLNDICADLAAIAERAHDTAIVLAEPIWAVRFLSVIVVAALAAVLAVIIPDVSVDPGNIGLLDFVQGFESAVNDILLCGAGVFFLVTWESRIKRKRALTALHELRSIAHIIDMHQLTKDPDRVSGRGSTTSSSPPQALTPFELGRYLDYCSEMLSLTGKIAALYAERLADPVVLGTVNEIESLCSDFSRKIWQKIMIINADATSREKR